MRRFSTVFLFELKSYIKNKSFIISTFLIAFIIGFGMFTPRIFDMSELLGTQNTEISQSEENSSVDDKEEELDKYGLIDANGYFTDKALLKEYLGDVEIIDYKDENELKKDLEKEEILGGYIVENDVHFRYLVWNNHMFDDGPLGFQELLSQIHKQNYCKEKKLDFQEFIQEYDKTVEFEQEVLGKDATDNYWYSYALVMVIFMIIILYCVMIATSVTSEKSNRAIEVLVTSVDSKYLLFGKVLAGTVAGVAQVAICLAVALIGYQVNRDAWGGNLDVVLNIPSEVLVGFALFGIGGFVFYAFLYGALGALVSKVEDVNKAIGGLQMVVMLVYFAVMFQLHNVDGVIMKVCSFLPISSYSAMFVRIAMGNVELWEEIVSFVILLVSTIAVGWIAAKIYRMGTLRYGNPISIRNALKIIKSDKE